jgi:hypothetical protein
MSRKILHNHTENSMGRSWNGSIAVLDKMAMEEALALFPGKPRCTSSASIEAEEAVMKWVHDRCTDEAGERLADVMLGQLPPWLILLDPSGVTLRWHGQGVWQRLSLNRRVFVLAAQRIADFYGFWYYHDGAVRRALQRAGVGLDDDGSPAWSHCRFEVGAPLAEEDGVLGDAFEGDALFRLLERPTGWNWERLSRLVSQGCCVSGSDHSTRGSRGKHARCLLETISKRGVPLPIHHAFNGKPDGLGRPDENCELLGSG